MIMYHVYVLQSLKDHRTYVGHTKDLGIRLERHNQGMVISTKSRRPLKLLFSEEFILLGEAKKRELWWKSLAGRKKLKSFFQSHPALPQDQLNINP